MRRLYRRRADMVVFATIGAISVGVLGIYFEVQEQRQDPKSSEAPVAETERLVLLPTTAPAAFTLERAEAEGSMPHLAGLLDEAAATGSAATSDRLVIDTIWFQLADAHGVPMRVPVVVEWDGERYRLAMTD